MKFSSLVFGAAVVFAACSTFEVDSKRFACTSDEQCGPEFKCVARVCVSSSSAVDAGGSGGGSAGGGTAQSGGGAQAGGGTTGGGFSEVGGGGGSATGGGTASTGGGSMGGGTASTGGGSATDAGQGGGTASTGGGSAIDAGQGGGTASTGGGSAIDAGQGGGTASTGGGSAIDAGQGGGTAVDSGVDAGPADAGPFDAGLPPVGCGTRVGEIAVWQGMVNVHKPAGGSWAIDSDCSSGAQNNTVAYCQKFWPATTAIIAETVSAEIKPFANAGCAINYPGVGLGQYACCIPPVDAGPGDAGTDAGTDAGVTPMFFDSKSLAGAPSATVTASITGGRAPFSLKFYDQNWVLRSTATPTGGLMNAYSVVLPNKAGVYTTLLTDSAGQRSYGQATVNTSTAYAYNFPPAGNPITPAGYMPYSAWAVAPVSVGDYDNDGYLDVAIGAGNNATNFAGAGKIWVYRGGAGGTLTLAVTITAPGVNTSFGGVHFVDMDQDGDLDLVAVFYGQSSLFVATNTGNALPTTATAIQLTTGSVEMINLDVADVDADGNADVLVFASQGSGATAVAFKVSQVGSLGAVVTPLFTSAVSPTIGPRESRWFDANDDGRLDLVVTTATGNGIVIVWGTSPLTSMSWATRYSVIIGSSLGLSAGYVNNDRRPDFVITADSSSGAFAWYLASNAASNTWSSTAIPTPTEQFSGTPAIADLNSDGVADVLVPFRNRYLLRNRMGALKKDATNVVTSITPADTTVVYGTSVANSWVESNPVIADFDGDGILDVGIYGTAAQAFDVLKGR